MYFRDDCWTYSPSDLTTFMQSPFGSWMDRFSLLNEEVNKHRDPNDALMAKLQQKGFSHEDEVLRDLLKTKQVIDIAQTPHNGSNKLAAQSAATIEAMKAGVDVIFQAYLCDDPFRGYADFLVKVDGASSLGDFHYEVWDSKLASTVKPYFIIQLCCYAQMIEKIQHRLPQHLTVVLGTKEEVKLKTHDYYYYYLALKNNFLSACAAFDPAIHPDPFDSKSYGHWGAYAARKLEEQDHLSQIANISRNQIKKLVNAGVHTCAQLIAREHRVEKLDPAIFARLKKQATLQASSVAKKPIDPDTPFKPDYEIIDYPADCNEGLRLLPPQSTNDIFFDIEGYPLIEGGLEYIWGASYFDESGKLQFKDFWAHDHAQEKLAFSGFIDWAYQRWIADPTMHIYHYASYEVTACRKLMGRYGCYEHEVDQLLRNNVFVDLYKVVKNSLIVGTPSYSIKQIELLYRDGKRGTDVADGGASIVVYEEWREQWLAGLASGSWEQNKTLENIRIYNKDDCDSTYELATWLRARQQEAGLELKSSANTIDSAEGPDSAPRHPLRDQLREDLLKKASDNNVTNQELPDLYTHLAWTLDFHQRANKPMWWRLFDRLATSTEELLDDSDCLANLVRTKREPFKATAGARNLSYEFKFPVEQEWKAGSKSYYVLGELNAKGNQLKVSINETESEFNQGLVVVACGESLPRVIHLIPDEFIKPDPIPAAIDKVAEDLLQHGLRDNAIYDFLNRLPPRVRNITRGEALITSTDAAERLNQVIDVVKNLDNSYFTIQGPPGTGKTFTAKKIIAELLRQNKRIGISSNSHKAINNLLFSVAEYCQEQQIDAQYICTGETDSQKIADFNIILCKNSAVIGQLCEGACVVGTTAWGFANDKFTDQFDYLFIDEAGQVAVANLIGMSASASNIVILGDQMQLGQPTQGTHPGESGLSILDYLLGDIAAISPDMGCFLSTTYRMHSQVNQFISDAIYDGKLQCHADNDQQKVIPLSQKLAQWPDYPEHHAGLIFKPVEHQGNTLCSDEEVEEIARLVDLLMDGEYICRQGKSRKITLEDMLFVSPYNYQVKLLKQRLGVESKVGSVDKFQGQEAPIVFFSMCSSDAEESPRGIDFLYSKNRINVAISRAQALAIVVGSPALCSPMINSVEQMKKVNLVSRLMTMDAV